LRDYHFYEANSLFFIFGQIVPRMLAENSGTKSAAAVLTELSAAHKEDNGKNIGYNIDAEQSLTTDLVNLEVNPFVIISCDR